MFGHLEHDVPAISSEDGAQRLSRHDEFGRRVQVEPCRLWQGLRGRQGSPERGRLQIDPETDRGRLGE